MTVIGNRLPAGTHVRLDSTGECGVVVHCWLDPTLDAYDCYVAFFGEAFPEGKPGAIPYVLRYFSGSLTVIDDPAATQRPPE